MLPPLILLELRLRALKPIRKLPHYQGPHWSAVLRHLLRASLPDEASLAKAGVWLQTVETGVVAYEEGEPIRLGLSFPAELAAVIGQALAGFNEDAKGQGHFQPGHTVALEEIWCRISGAPWDWRQPQPLTEQVLATEAQQLGTLERFTLELHTPLRMTRPAGAKAESHRFVDEEYLKADRTGGPSQLLPALLQRLRLPQEDAVESAGLRLDGGAVSWLDVPYGNPKGKTLGGLIGRVRFCGRLTPALARLLVAGQYWGAGKNAPFGFGFYTIPELDAVRRIVPHSRGLSLLQRAVRPAALASALGQLSNSSPGPDGLSAADLKAAGEPFLEQLAAKAAGGQGLAGPVKRYRLAKADGDGRQIYVQNAAERLVHRALSAQLTPAVEGLLSNSSYAYRQGLSRRSAAATLKTLLGQGYTTGIKADIAAFFDSVRQADLLDLLSGYFPAEPSVGLIAEWLAAAAAAGAEGLPQGGTLSPVLSNLYLDRFDRAMAGEGFRLVRFADDFVVLFRQGQSADEGLATVRQALARLGLLLKPEKTEQLVQGKPLRFLGLLVSAEVVADAEREETEEPSQWAPIFRDEWQSGQPVYLTTLSRGAFSSGGDLVIQGEDKQEKIPWSRISRLVVVGRSRFSGGVIYRAMREAIPVSFIDIMGRTTGQLHPANWPQPDLVSIQKERGGDEEFKLGFVREIVSAKISNHLTLLRRNDAPRHELTTYLERILEARDIEQLRGYEGIAARVYFEAFAGLVAPFEFRGRIFRPPDGPVNVMLSFGYTLLYNRISAVLRDKGFDPRLGLFHQGRGTHSALASDLQEELRHLVDRIVLSLIHLKEVKPEDFEYREIHGQRMCRLGGEAFRALVRRFEKTMSRKFNHGGRGQISYNAYLDEMAESLRRSLRLGIPYQALRIR